MNSALFAVFPGQGSQHAGMGKELHDGFAVARETFEEASEAVHRNLAKLCFEGTDSELALTENTQPCLLTVSVASFRVAQAELGLEPQLAAGHSLGEYSALVALGALPLGAAAAWVQERGRAMQGAVPVGQGSMAAVMGLDDEKIARLCEAATRAAKEARARGECTELEVEPLLEPANFNAPGQTVVSGSKDAIAQALGLLKTDPSLAGGKAIPLSVSAPFHSRLMRPARDRMAELFGSATEAQKPRAPRVAYFPTRTARATREPGVIFELLVDQVDHPVLWRQSFEAALSSGAELVLEFGPGKVLQGLGKRIAQASGRSCRLSGFGGMGNRAGLEALEALLKGVSHG
jgi:[acyl-carrier-protein] S-malonyltransferase